MRLKIENHNSKIKEAENPESQQDCKRDRFTALYDNNKTESEPMAL
jgi:hypothetical protein